MPISNAAGPRENTINSLLVSFWNRIRFSFWFIPALMATGSILLSLATVYADRELLPEDASDTFALWLYSGGAQGARAVLTTIASSMITIAGVVFSMTLVALTLASSQFGPRLLRNYMGDRSNQFVLGTFIASFLFCLLVLRSIRLGNEEVFVPHLSVTTGLLLAIINIGVLIHFIHHVALSIQGDSIVARIGRELIDVIDRHVAVDDSAGEGAGNSGAADFPLGEGHVVTAGVDGYVQYVDVDALLRAACRHEARIRLLCHPGQYRAADSPMARLYCDEDSRSELGRAIRSAVNFGLQPTSAQDVEFGIRQLVEVALRAMSPGINDPYTAMQCLDRLGSALSRLEGRYLPAEQVHCFEDRARLLTPQASYADLVELAFVQIRQNLRGGSGVTIHMLDTFDLVLESTTAAGRRELLLQHANLVKLDALREMSEEHDRDRVEERYRILRECHSG